MTTLEKGLTLLKITYTSEQLEKTDLFYEMLEKRNRSVNLTRITDKEEFYVKHILDSLSIFSLTDLYEKKILDVGTGAGFPGIPLNIFFPDNDFLLLDSVQKKLSFINEAVQTLNLEGISTAHGRAEDLGRNNLYREKFDIVISRAVADLSVLSELCIPFVKQDGIFIAYKSLNCDNELNNSKYAIDKLSGTLESVNIVDIPLSDIKRKIIIIRKTGSTKEYYPRKAGIISKRPLKK